MREGTEDAEASSGIACDKTGLATSFGLGAAKLFGWKPEEVVGKQRVAIFQRALHGPYPAPEKRLG